MGDAQMNTYGAEEIVAYLEKQANHNEALDMGIREALAVAAEAIRSMDELLQKISKGTWKFIMKTDATFLE